MKFTRIGDLLFKCFINQTEIIDDMEGNHV